MHPDQILEHPEIAHNLENFVPLPSDPATPLTDEQLSALFPKANRPAFLRELVRLMREREGEQPA